MREVIQRIGKEPSLVMVEGKKGSAPGFRINPPLILEKENCEYTVEAANLFYAYKFK